MAHPDELRVGVKVRVVRTVPEPTDPAYGIGRVGVISKRRSLSERYPHKVDFGDGNEDVYLASELEVVSGETP